MFCRNCGKELAEGAQFCHNCGENISSESKEKKTGDFTDKVMNYKYPIRSGEFYLLKEDAKKSIEGIWFYLFLVYLLVSLVSSIPYIGWALAFISPIPLFFITKGVAIYNNFEIDLIYKPFTRMKKPLMIILKVFGASLLITLITIVGCFLFIIPGIYFALTYSQTIYLLIDNPDLGIFDAMEMSKNHMEGHKWEFFVFCLSFIGHFLLVALTFGIYSIYAIPYIQVAHFNYYCYLRGSNQ